MSVYQIHKFCRRILHDPVFRDLAIRQPEIAVGQFSLTKEEQVALLAGDVGTLFNMGASAFLLLILSRFEIFGLKLPIYNERMRNLRKT
ncbi:MAG: hypothetical protein EKK40_18960 [Bradyrhizobiaceae bacterium]|nr:MAG: hypothetical protein EKK40_18960 [Bradyrhizobiaceae bacterium]